MVSETNQPPASPPDWSRRLKQWWAFFVFEIKAVRVLLWSYFWKSTLVSALFLLGLVAYSIYTNRNSTLFSGTVAEGILAVFFLVGLCVCYSLPVGIAVGGIRICWRLFGDWTLVPIILIPLFIGLSFWLFSGWLHDTALGVGEAFLGSLITHGFPATKSFSQAMMVARAGPIAAIIVIVLLLPCFLYDVLWILLDWHFLWSVVVFFFSLVAVFAIGFVPSSVMSAIVLAIAFWSRLMDRYELFEMGVKEE